jgi:hypothetical protein
VMAVMRTQRVARVFITFLALALGEPGHPWRSSHLLVKADTHKSSAPPIYRCVTPRTQSTATRTRPTATGSSEK